MQGVRTTIGCVSCKRRRKGCDLQRPICGRCERLGVTCRYEERKWTFINEAAGPSDRAAPAPELRVDVPSSALTGTMQSSLAQTETELQTEVEFWNIYLPGEHPGLDGSIGGVLSAPWIPTVRALAEDDRHLRAAVQACVFAGLGWMRDDLSLVQRGLGWYAYALRETNAALQDPARVRSDSALASCRVLSLFEMFRRSPNQSGADQNQVIDWRSHVDGTCRIVELRGRERHTSGHGLELYDAVRMTAIISGVTRRKPNAFTSLSWDMPRRRTLRDDLFDLVNTVPDLLQQIDWLCDTLIQNRVDEDRDRILQLGRELIQRCISMGRRLCEWEAKAIDLCRQNAAAQSFGSIEVTTSAAETRLVSLLDVSKSHGNGFFFICTQYWAICIILYGSSRLFYQRVTAFLETAYSDEAIPQLPRWVNPEIHALNIGQTASHFFRPEAGLWSAQTATFPVGTALFFFVRTGRRDSAAFKTMTDAFKNNKAGAVMRDFLQNVVDAQHSG